MKSPVSYMLMTFFKLPFLIKGNKAAMTLFTPTTLVFKCSLKSFLFGYQPGENHICGKSAGTNISTIPFGVMCIMPALLMR